MAARVLVVCSFVPFPVHGGDSVRVFGLLRALAKKVHLTLWCVETSTGDISGLRTLLPDVDVVVYTRDRSSDTRTVGNAFRYGAAARRGVPSWVLKRESSALVAALAADRTEWDGVAALGEASAQYFEKFSKPWHWDKFNVQSVSVAEAFSWRMGVLATLREYVNLNATLRYEARWARRASTVSVTNSEEADRYRALFGGSPIVVHSTVPVAEDVCRSPIPGRLVWLGSFGYESNRKGLRLFLEQGWPALSADFVLRVIGSGMSEQDRVWLSKYRNVEPVGFVEDVSAELLRAQLGVVPIWSGGGTKMKTLTMMAAGLPIVSSPAGVEGLSVATEAEFYLATRPADLSVVVRRAVSDPGLDLVAARGRERILREFTEHGIQEQYVALVRHVTGAENGLIMNGLD